MAWPEARERCSSGNFCARSVSTSTAICNGGWSTSSYRLWFFAHSFLNRFPLLADSVHSPDATIPESYGSFLPVIFQAAT